MRPFKLSTYSQYFREGAHLIQFSGNIRFIFHNLHDIWGRYVLGLIVCASFIYDPLFFFLWSNDEPLVSDNGIQCVSRYLLLFFIFLTPTRLKSLTVHAYYCHISKIQSSCYQAGCPNSKYQN